MSVNFHEKRSKFSCSLLKDENSSLLLYATVFQNLEYCLFVESAKNFLLDINLMNTLSKRSSQTSEGSVMCMGDRNLRQRAINEENGLFSIIYSCHCSLTAANHMAGKIQCQFSCWKLCSLALISQFSIILKFFLHLLRFQTFHTIIVASPQESQKEMV